MPNRTALTVVAAAVLLGSFACTTNLTERELTKSNYKDILEETYLPNSRITPEDRRLLEEFINNVDWSAGKYTVGSAIARQKEIEGANGGELKRMREARDAAAAEMRKALEFRLVRYRRPPMTLPPLVRPSPSGSQPRRPDRKFSMPLSAMLDLEVTNRSAKTIDGFAGKLKLHFDGDWGPRRPGPGSEQQVRSLLVPISTELRIHPGSVGRTSVGVQATMGSVLFPFEALDARQLAAKLVFLEPLLERIDFADHSKLELPK